MSQFKAVVGDSLKGVSDPTRSRELITWILTLVFAAVLIFLNQTARKLTVAEDLPEERRIAPVFNADLSRLLSFGHEPVLVDLMLIRFLGDDTMTKVAPGRHARIFHELDLANEIDPRFMAIPFYGAMILTVVRDDHVGALHLINKAERFRTHELPAYPQWFRELHWPHAWRILMLRGYLNLYEMRDFPAAAEDFSRLEDIPEAISFHGLARKLQTREGQIEVALRTLDRLLEMERDETRRDTLVQKREEVLLEQDLLQISESFRASLPARTPPTEERFRAFLRDRVRQTDLQGGRLFLNERGEVDTTTPRGFRFR